MDNMFNLSQVAERIGRKIKRVECDWLARRPFLMTGTTSFISFTFDDFPTSAYNVGGAILKNYGLNGTYYVSLGMLNRQSPTGEIAGLDVIRNVFSDGHELGCHTYLHSDPWETRPDQFEMSIIENQRALLKLLPKVRFNTFSYPFANATSRIKRIASKYFACCRGGRQTLNSGKIDLNYLNAYFIDRRKNVSLSALKTLISRNSEAKGWLIFATHGIDNERSAYGCTPDFFEDIVRYSIKSGAVVLPVDRTCAFLKEFSGIV